MTMTVTLRRQAEEEEEPDSGFALTYDIGSGTGPFLLVGLLLLTGAALLQRLHRRSGRRHSARA